jgi:hypothetical protein
VCRYVLSLLPLYRFLFILSFPFILTMSRDSTSRNPTDHERRKRKVRHRTATRCAREVKKHKLPFSTHNHDRQQRTYDITTSQHHLEFGRKLVCLTERRRVVFNYSRPIYLRLGYMNSSFLATKYFGQDRIWNRPGRKPPDRRLSRGTLGILGTIADRFRRRQGYYARHDMWVQGRGILRPGYQSESTS